MKIIMKSFLITLAFSANASLGLSVTCTDADPPWDFQTIGIYTVSEGQMHEELYVYSFLDYWLTGQDDPDPHEWSGGVVCFNLEMGTGQCHHRINVAVGVTAILEGSSSFETGIPYVHCPYAYYWG